MTFLLDTNAAIAVIKGAPAGVRARLRDALADGAPVAVSSIALFELWFGVANSARREDNSARLKAFLSGNIQLLSFDDEDARVAGDVRATLKRAGTPIGPYDLLIAGQALRHAATLVTANVAEFGRVPGLRWEDWAAPDRPLGRPSA